MDTNARTKIIETIAKLSAMTNPNANAFQGEINNAAAKIQELMDKYSITQDELDAKNMETSKQEMNRGFESKGAEYVIKGVKNWHWRLADVIGRITHTKNYARTSGTRCTMVFYGDPNNSTIASSLYTEWVQIIEAMSISATDDYWKVVMKKYNYAGWLKEKKANGYSDKFMDTVPFEERTTHYKSSWLEGCIQSITKAVQNAEDERSKEVSTALVVYDAKLNSEYAIMTKRFTTMKVSRPRGHSDAGYAAGREAGSKIKIGLNKVGG